MNIAVTNKIQGTAVTAWAEASPRDLLIRTVNGDTGLSIEEVAKKFKARLKRSRRKDELLDVIIEYWVANNYNHLRTNAHSRTRDNASDALLERMKAKLAAKIKDQVRIALLDMVTPLNKPLRDCTGAECLAMGKGFRSIGEAIPEESTVGETLDERAVRELYVS